MQCPCQLCNTNQVASVQRDFKSGEGKDAEASWFGYHGDISALRVACLSQHKKILEVTEEKVLCGTSASICQTLHCVGLDLSKHAHLGPGIASMTLQEQFSSLFFIFIFFSTLFRSCSRSKGGRNLLCSASLLESRCRTSMKNGAFCFRCLACAVYFL